ncbi:hypothetical protein [Deinococcus enclensis]|uniref:Uncharacterized protein n=1 Tax=Deinococcus enclensis TaxID=1049582 RepID=A0ABT9MFV7_9DEIO|nr:hypothetical protein [Deinococcus enclensis]MDP9765487.1 hypothetical protein [Deinococcus enclensis]
MAGEAQRLTNESQDASAARRADVSPYALVLGTMVSAERLTEDKPDVLVFIPASGALPAFYEV